MSAMSRDAVSELPRMRDAPTPDPEHMIKDQDFMRDLKRLRALREFLRQSEVQISKEGREACAFGDLNLLQNGLGMKGRPPTRWEWDEVEWRTQFIWDLLSESSRKRFILGEIPGWISPAILLLAAAALGALLWSMLMLTQGYSQSASLLSSSD